MTSAPPTTASLASCRPQKLLKLESSNSDNLYIFLDFQGKFVSLFSFSFLSFFLLLLLISNTETLLGTGFLELFKQGSLNLVYI